MQPDDSLPPDVSGPTGSLPPASAPGPAPLVAESRRYTRDGILGKGGMGVVYLAHDHRLGRPVALKEAARAGETAGRLAAEAMITASLDHPGIVTVHDSGVTEDGRPFYTMRLLRGRPLSVVLAERTTVHERLQLVRHYLNACDAVAYAHAEGVVHRDLKPANVMVGGFGETQVVDWGLAARVGAPGEPVGTPAYMSPEQARGETVCPTADVWSLGTMLRELLGPHGPPELAAIAEQALAVDPADRYPNAGALAADVAAWLDGRPVNAHHYGPGELLRRLVRAWRAPILVGGIALGLVVVLVAGGTLRLASERDRVAAAEAEAVRALASSDAHLAQALTAEARGALTDGVPAVAAVLASHAVALKDAPEAWGVLAGVALEARAQRLATGLLPGCAHYVPIAEGDGLCLTPRGVSRLERGQPRWSWAGQPGSYRLDVGRLFVSEGAEATALTLESGVASVGWKAFGLAGSQLWPVRLADWGVEETPEALNTLEASLCPGSALATAAPAMGLDRVVVICLDGRVATTARGSLPAAYLETPATREALSGVVAAEVTRDGERLVLAGSKGRLAVVELRNGETTMATTAGRDGAWTLAISDDGRRLALAGDRGQVEVRSLPDLDLLVSLPVSARAIRFLPDGTLLVAEPGAESRWKLPAEREAARLRGPDGLTAVTFSPDGRHLATGHGTREGIVWALATSSREGVLGLGAGTAKAVAFTPDGTTAWFAVSGARGSWKPRALRLDGNPAMEVPDAMLAKGLDGRLTFPTRRAVILANGVLIAPGYADERPLAMDTRRAEPVPLTDCPAIEWFDAAQSPGGEHAVLVGAAGRVTSIRATSPLRCDGGFRWDGAVAADVAADGSLVVADASEVRRTDGAGVVHWRAPYPGGRVLDVAISGDGRWIAAGGTDHVARLWDDTGRLRAVLAGHDERVASLDFHPNGRVLATGSWDGTARLWGLDVLLRPAAELESAAAADWGLTLAEALTAAGG